MALLLCVNYYEDDLRMYFVPDPKVLPKNLLAALEKMHGVFCNSDEFTKSYWKAWDYLSAAITENPEHLDSENKNDQNRFAHKLLPFRIDASHTLHAGTEFIVSSKKLTIIQTGSF